MSISSAGYTGTVTEVSWAKMAPLNGTHFTVADAASWKVTSGGSGDRAVTVAAGTAFGSGVLDINSASINVNLDILSSGTVRYDTVVIRRTWGGSAATTVAVCKGTSAAAITLTNTTPGVIEDQPLALVQVTSSSVIAATQIQDLRTQSGKQVLTATAPTLTIPTPALGSTAISLDNNHQWVAETVGSSVVWVDLDDPGWTTMPMPGGLTAIDTVPQYRVVRGHVFFKGTVQHTAAAGKPVQPLVSGAEKTDGTADVQIGSLPAGARPSSIRRGNLTPVGSINAVRAKLLSDGTFWIYADGLAVQGVDLSQFHYPAEQ